MTDKQGIRPKMHEMAILETLFLKTFWDRGGTCTNTYDQHLGFSNLGSMQLTCYINVLKIVSTYLR